MNKKERRLALATALQSASPATTIIEDLTVSADSNLLSTRARGPQVLMFQAYEGNIAFRFPMPISEKPEYIQRQSEKSEGCIEEKNRI